LGYRQQETTGEKKEMNHLCPKPVHNTAIKARLQFMTLGRLMALFSFVAWQGGEGTKQVQAAATGIRLH
jgi:hypothetical protein